MNYDIMYHNKSLWEDTIDSPMIRAKIPLILSWIPNQVKTILDVGCGNGIITNVLEEHFEITGVDYSDEALKHVVTPKILASATNIPVPDHSFDLVFSSEMLEHLDDSLLSEALAEMSRIASQFIFLTIPDRENLFQNFVKCDQCGAEFHKYGHVQSFDEERLSRMLGDSFRLIRYGSFGPLAKQYIPSLLRVRTQKAGVWSTPEKHTICPACGNTQLRYQRGNLLSKSCNLLNRVFGRSRRYWLFCLFERVQ